jgi:hypothetical protein
MSVFGKMGKGSVKEVKNEKKKGGKVRRFYIRKCFVASFVVTDMRLFPSMRSRMDCQRTPLDKALVAIFYRTVVWSLVGMYAIVSAKVRLAIERLLGSLVCVGLS